MLRTERLLLTPLRVGDAREMVGVLADPELYVFTGGQPPTLEDLTTLYRSQVAGPGQGDELWHNWILRSVVTNTAVGFVQATVVGDSADLAWVVGGDWQGQGFAKEGAAALKGWLASSGTEHFAAHVHPEHVASQRVAAAIGLRRSGEIDEDDEEIWTGHPDPHQGERPLVV
ncbi:MAG: GNAT family N-acetyltransferase [Actinomycetota bacterium]|nr:GNAT family N-acetyltransferase [Actinomycetota bacterium]